MLHEIKLEICSFRIKDRNSKNEESLDFSSIFNSNENTTDFQNFKEEFVNFNDSLNINENIKKSIQIKKDTLKIELTNNNFSGIIESGEYGSESEIVSSITKEIRFKKNKEDIDIKPFYFLIWLPKIENINNVGFFILQRTGNDGINTIFKDRLSNYFTSKNELYKVEFSNYIPNDLAKEYLSKGKIKEFKIRSYSLPSDLADKLGLKDYKEDISKFEIKIFTKKEGFNFNLNNKLKNFINNTNSKFFDIQDWGIDGNHSESIKIKVGDNIRTINLADSLKIRPYYNISNDNLIDVETGHPIFKEIDKLAKKLINDINLELN